MCSSDLNLRRLARAEEIAKEKGVPVSRIALSWMLHQPMDIYPVISTASAEKMRSNIAAANIRLTPQECAWLNLEREDRG